MGIFTPPDKAGFVFICTCITFFCVVIPLLLALLVLLQRCASSVLSQHKTKSDPGSITNQLGDTEGNNKPLQASLSPPV